MIYNYTTTKIIKEKLEEYDIEILNEYQNDESEMICSKFFNIVCKQDEVFIHFDAATKPFYSARIILIIGEVASKTNGIDIILGDDFYMDENKKMLFNNEAYDKFIFDFKNKLISDFLKQQSDLYLLHNAKTFNC